MILVTGGTGLIGSHLLFHLAGKEKKVRALYRTKKSLEKVKRVFGFYTEVPDVHFNTIDWVQADITDVLALETTFSDIQEVYHAAALISFDPAVYKTLLKANVEGTANVVNLCVKYQIQKLCYVSSIAAIGSNDKGMVTEKTSLNIATAGVYGLTKHQAELEVWRGTQEGVPAVIVNPGVVLGPGFWRSGSGSFFTYASKGKKAYLPGGTGFVGIEDVVSAMMHLMHSEISNERFILVNQNWSYKTLLERITPHLDVKPPSKQIPFWLLELFWRWDWLRSKLRGKRRRLPKAMMKGLYHQDEYSNQKIKDMLGFSFGDLDETIAFCCDKFKSRRQSP